VYLARNYAKIQGPAGSGHGYEFELKVVETNEEAIKKSVRYVEEDLNRCFLCKDLDNPEHTTLYEHRRAKEINNLLGPKTSASPVCDYILDLHNTTAATGVALFVHPRDKFSQGLAAYLKSVDPSVQVALWANRDVMLLPSVGRSGMTFEVGPVSIKCLDAALYKQSQTLIDASLKYMATHNAARKRASDDTETARKKETLQCIQMIRAIPFPRGSDKDLSGMIHPAIDGKDFSPLKLTDPAFLMFDGSSKSVSDIVGATDDLPEVIYPFLINEASYYEKDTAFLIGKFVEYDVDVLDVPTAIARM
jgi:succinylglutamate desuccinylase